MVIKIIKNEFRQMLHPNAIVPLKLDSINVPMQKRVTLLAFLASYMLILAISIFLMSLAGVESVDCVSISFSSLGNVGPAFGSDIGPNDLSLIHICYESGFLVHISILILYF